MFASQVKKTISIEGDEPGTVTIRKLSAKQLERASEVKQNESIESASRVGADLMRVFRELPGEKLEKAKQLRAESAHYGSYDRFTVLKEGILEWSYSVTLKQGLEELDEENAEKIFREILDLSLPGLRENASKNA